MSRPKGPARVRLQPYADPATVDRLHALCAARGTTESAIVEKALRQYLNGTHDVTLILRRMDRLGRDVRKVHRDVELLSETFAIWVKLWFAHNPNIPDEGRRAARSSAESRYKQFVEHVAEQFADGKRFIDDLPRETVADEEELAELVASDVTP